MLQEKIGVIGAGKIGSAILRGVLNARLVEPKRLIASAPSEERRRALAAELGIALTAENREVCDFADVVFLAVKPQVADAVLDEISGHVTEAKLVVSVAAGVPCRRIEARLGKPARVVRVMTNTPCVVGAAASCYAAGSRATPEDLRKVGTILSSVGIALNVPERYLDAVTGLSGSGPAYVFLFIEALADGGVQAGLARDAALKLALQTVYGAAKLALESGRHVGQLKDEVTSPGGTTIAGLYALERKGFRGTVMDAVVHATRRSEELGRES
ncbi:MAG TPA: pyrroline-5-carboxylate reductase [candidate division Zixibacteria bacterium]|nr:pyrroline-5-carboxylate reductase [candidate division Zixibacteria bacterium]